MSGLALLRANIGGRRKAGALALGILKVVYRIFLDALLTGGFILAVVLGVALTAVSNPADQHLYANSAIAAAVHRASWQILSSWWTLLFFVEIARLMLQGLPAVLVDGSDALMKTLRKASTVKRSSRDRQNGAAAERFRGNDAR